MPEETGSLSARSISVPSIVADFTDEQLNSGYHSKIEYEQAIEKYGTIYKVVDFNDYKKKEDIKQAAKEWIRLHYFDGVRSFNVKAVDLHMLGFNKDKIRVGDRVTVEFLDLYDQPITKTLTCMSAQIDLLNPGNSSYKIGIPDTSLSLKHRFPNSSGSGGGGGGGGSSSNGGTGGTSGANTNSSDTKAALAKKVESLYSYTLNVEDAVQINADNIELYAQQVTENADGYYRTSDDVNNIQRSAVIQNAAEIVEVVGQFNVKDNYYGDWPAWSGVSYQYKVGDRVQYDGHGYICIKDIPAGYEIPLSNTTYWSEVTGRKAVELINGAAFEIDDLNGSRFTVGSKIGEYDTHFESVDDSIGEFGEFVEEFEGSALWTQKDNITGVCGEFEVHTDPLTGVKTIVIKSGGGMKIRKDNVEYGIYSADELTGGLVVDKINTANWPQWRRYTHYDVGDQIVYGGVAYTCKVSHDVEGTFDPSKWEEYHSTDTKILGTRIDIRAEQLVALGVYTNNSLTGGIIAEKINSGGNDSKINFSQLDSSVTDYTAMGLFDNNTLTGGVLVQKLNDSSTVTTISGDKINITTNDDFSTLSISHSGLVSVVGGQGEAISTLSNTVDGFEVKLQPVSDASGNVTPASIATAINSQGQAGVKLSGSWIDINANQVRFGDTSDVEAQFGVQDGIIANKATVSELNAVKTRVGTIEANYLTANSIDSNFITSRISSSAVITCSMLNATTLNQIGISEIVRNVYIEDNGDGTYKLVKLKWDGTLTEYTFERGGGEPSSYQLNYKSSPYTYHVRVKVGETWYESGNLSATNAYDNGWENSYGQIELSVSGSDTPETPTYGDYLFVKAMGKATSGASSKTTPTGQSLGITIPADRWNDGGATAKMNKASKTLTWDEAYVITAQYVNADGDTVSTSRSITVTAPADRYGTGWTAAYNKVEMPGAGTSGYIRVKYPSSTTDQQTYQDFDVSADNDYAYIKKGTTTVARKAHSAYANGANSVTVTDVSINGSPAASATTVPVIATASNGATKTASIGITTQRNNAYNAGGATAKVNKSDTTLGYGGSITVTAQYVNAAGTTTNTSSKCVITAPADNYSTGYNSGFSDGIVAVRQVYSESNRYVDMVYNGAWTGVNGYYIGDMLDSSYNSGAGYGWNLAYGKCSATMHGASSGGTLDITRPGATWDNSVTTTYTTAGLELWAYRGMTLYYYDQGSQRSVRVPNVIYTGSPYITTA